MSKPQKIVVVGAGPVGALAALYAALRGHQVEVYELRNDLRDLSTVPLNFTRSINLALSERGINSIRQTGCDELLNNVVEDAIPLYGRMVHDRKDGYLHSHVQRYDVHGRHINAIDRAGLNRRLLEELTKHPNVTIFFHHKLTGADFDRNTAWFEVRDPSSKYSNERRAPEVSVSFDLMIGADGAHSAVRFHMMKFAHLSYTQEYIDTLWCEFNIQASTEPMHQTSKRTGFRLSPNHLHIWPAPAGEFMFIAIASPDGSFTCTLFTTIAVFADLESGKTDLVQFFEDHFPGVVGDLIQPDALREQFRANPHLPLISIKCSPHSYGSSGVIVGDAAHAMVPFYGQGMNAGLEDVRVLFEHLDASTFSDESAASARANALAAYTAHRIPDAHTINDLAMGNYQEMRSHVRSPLYLLRKSVEEKLSIWAPWTGFATQYSRVSFENERYSEVERLARWQGRLLGWVGSTLGVTVVALGAGSAWWFGRRR